VESHGFVPFSGTGRRSFLNNITTNEKGGIMKRVKRIMGLLVMAVVVIMLSMATTACTQMPLISSSGGGGEGGEVKKKESSYERAAREQRELKQKERHNLFASPRNMNEKKSYKIPEIEKIALAKGKEFYANNKDPKLRFTPERVEFEMTEWWIVKDDWNRPTKRWIRLIFINKEDGKWVGRDSFRLENNAADFGGKWSDKYKFLYTGPCEGDECPYECYPRELLNYKP